MVLRLARALPRQTLRRLVVVAVALLIVAQAGWHVLSVARHRGSHYSLPWVVVDDPARDASPITQRILELIGASPGMWVADVGAGGGYLTVKLAALVGPSGRITGTDIDPHMIEILRWESWRRGLHHVSVRHVEPFEGGLERDTYDRVIMVNVYPFLVCREAEGKRLLHGLLAALRPTGKLVTHHDFVHTAEWVPPTGPPLPCHQASAEVIVAWAAPAAHVELLEDSGWGKRSEPGIRPGYRLVLQRRAAGSN